jgi:hypothetical protein
MGERDRAGSGASSQTIADARVRARHPRSRQSSLRSPERQNHYSGYAGNSSKFTEGIAKI